MEPDDRRRGLLVVGGCDPAAEVAFDVESTHGEHCWRGARPKASSSGWRCSSRYARPGSILGIEPRNPAWSEEVRSTNNGSWAFCLANNGRRSPTEAGLRSCRPKKGLPSGRRTGRNLSFARGVLGVMSALRGFFATGLAILLLSAPAEAKLYTTDEVIVQGPGINGELRISSHDWFLRRTKEPGTNYVLAGLFQTGGRVDRPEGDLGPPYLITYRLTSLFDQSRADVKEVLYPFAAEGAIFRVSQQTVQLGEFTLEVEAGWIEAPPNIVRHLQHMGLPTTPPPSNSLVWLITRVGVAILAVAVLIFIRRTSVKRRAEPALSNT